jgi:hypothetical protein
MATKKPVYGYTIADDVDRKLADQSGDKFDEDKLLRGKAQLMLSSVPDRKAMRYMGSGNEANLDATNAGAGRGKAPTDSKMAKKSGGVIKKMASGGVTRADGCITKGHTRGKMV